MNEVYLLIPLEFWTQYSYIQITQSVRRSLILPCLTFCYCCLALSLCGTALRRTPIILLCGIYWRLFIETRINSGGSKKLQCHFGLVPKTSRVVHPILSPFSSHLLKFLKSVRDHRLQIIPTHLLVESITGYRLFSYERSARKCPHRRRARGTWSCQYRSTSYGLI